MMAKSGKKKCGKKWQNHYNGGGSQNTHDIYFYFKNMDFDFLDMIKTPNPGMATHFSIFA